MQSLSRRSLLAACAGLSLAGPTLSAERRVALGEVAARSGRYFGSAVTRADVAVGSEHVRFFAEECSVWVPAWEMKWGALVQALGQASDYRAADAIVDSAKRNDKRLRGHTLIWHEHLPVGAEGLSSAADWKRFLAPHIAAVAGRYRDAIFEWDVVNEAIEPYDNGADLMRRTPFYAMLGPDYVAEAFRIAADAAPAARLYLNDDHLYYAEDWQERRRTGVLHLLERLIKADVPIHGFGMQFHLDTRLRFNEQIFRRFLKHIEELGLTIAVTELDVTEAPDAARRSIVARRQRAATEVAKVLSVAIDSSALAGVVTWGLSDADSWLRDRSPDMADNQGLPFDDAYRPTPMRNTLASLFASTRTRHPT
ncbi:endo-1,4-beta-xylanase [Pleomorphomonas sp. PLEO]|uniref:endo-1,4-beta-xylanase n=1 Tax=Pleomorphomonas sp. PLEO TaxID=3239306 RepID=UPI00351E3883